MIYGIGVDIVQTERFIPWLKKQDLMERFFHEDEVKYIKSVGSSAIESMAARYAAKEALGKALGTGLTGITLKNICVQNNKEGKPEIQIYGDVKCVIDKLGITKIYVSLTHEKNYAVAFVLLEKEAEVLRS